MCCSPQPALCSSGIKINLPEEPSAVQSHLVYIQRVQVCDFTNIILYCKINILIHDYFYRERIRKTVKLFYLDILNPWWNLRDFLKLKIFCFDVGFNLQISNFLINFIQYSFPYQKDPQQWILMLKMSKFSPNSIPKLELDSDILGIKNQCFCKFTMNCLIVLASRLNTMMPKMHTIFCKIFRRIWTQNIGLQN